MIELTNNNLDSNKNKNNLLANEDEMNDLLNQKKGNTSNCIICILYITLIASIFAFFIINYTFTHNNFQISTVNTFSFQPKELCDEYFEPASKCMQDNKTVIECYSENYAIETCYSVVQMLNENCYIYINEVRQCLKDNINNSCYLSSKDLKSCIKNYKIINFDNALQIIKKSVM